jgi:hypothetical protein
MYVIATFEHSFQLEVALYKLETNGIDRDHIFIVSLAPKLGQKQLFETIHRSDGISIITVPSIMSTALSVLGTIYGFLLPWGPIIWGIMGIVVGWTVGLAVNILVYKKRMRRKKLKGAASEVVVMIECKDDQQAFVTNALYDHDAIGIGKVQR